MEERRNTKHSIFTNADWNDPDFTRDKENLTADAMLQAAIGQIRYILHDPQISRARKMLTIEQFRNPQMAAQLCLPISVWINLCDREPEREGEVM